MTESASRDDQLLKLSRKVAKHLSGVYPSGIDYDDAVAEAYIIARRNADRYDRETPPVPVKLWMWVRTVNDLRDRFEVLRRQSRAFTRGTDQRDLDPSATDRRRRGRFPEAGGSSNQDAIAAGCDHTKLLPPSALDPLRAATLRADLRAALDVLPRRLRRMVEAVYFGGMTQEQVAAEFKVSQPAVSKSLDRAFSLMRDALGPEYADE